MKFKTNFSDFINLVNEAFDYNKLISEIKYSKDWMEIKNTSPYPNAIFGAEYLIEKGYKILLLIKKNNNFVTSSFYLKNEIIDQLLWLDSLDTPIANRSYGLNKIDWMIGIAKNQIDYYHQIEKMPDKEEIKDMLTDVTDLGFEIDSIELGYVNNSFPTDYWDREVTSTYNGNFVCAIYLSANEESTKNDIKSRVKINKSKNEINLFMKRAESAFNVRTSVYYFQATGDGYGYTMDNGVVITLKNK